ncbi:MAG TPA: plastocyanin/azurin family copper-binding protein [Bradyrhizobium sp.]|jgi:plastocyanin|nr:plastocyanin/azurin family copper-binding protein [Bradyrhizobium sp.]
MRMLTSLTVVVLVGLSAGALAANLTITQKGRLFSSESITIKKGESVTFANDDTVPHNIISASKGNEFNLGSQPPGAATDVTFKESGEAQVICAIHPRMKMTVKITD